MTLEVLRAPEYGSCSMPCLTFSPRAGGGMLAKEY